jgi:hypothetical protein
MIVKDKGEMFILESIDEDAFCSYHSREKDGPIMSNARTKINKCPGRVYLCKNNLHKFITDRQIMEQFKKYENQHFMEDGLLCVDLISNILSDLGVMRRPGYFYTPCEFIDPKNYKVGYNPGQNVKLQNDFVIHEKEIYNNRE